MWTLAEIKEMYKGEYVEMEVYRPISYGRQYPNHFHTDNCRSVENYSDSEVVGLYELMDEDDYDASILANGCIYADFEGWYGDKNAKILCIMLKYPEGYDPEMEEL